MLFSSIRQGIIVVALALSPVLVQAQAAPARDPFETVQAQNYCVFRCDTGSASGSASEEYGKWHAEAMPQDQCRPNCSTRCDSVCGQVTVQAPGSTSRTTAPTRRGQPRTSGGTAAAPEQTTARCSLNSGTNTNLSPICVNYDPIGQAQSAQSSGGQVSGTPGICVFRCAGQTNWQAAQMNQCNPQGCQSRCNLICGGTACTAESAMCQPLPGVGSPSFPQTTTGPQGGSAPSDQTQARQAQSLGFGLRDPLGGVSIQRLIAGLIRFVIGMIGALFLGLFVWSGVQWMTAGGEADKVSEAKQTMVNATIGMIIVIGAWTLVSLVIDYSNEVLRASQGG